MLDQLPARRTAGLQISGLGFRYPGRGWLFRGVDLQVRPGSVTSVLGTNGRGKTTLIKCAAGLLQPTEGRVVGVDQVGYVPQAHGGVFSYPVLDMVLMGRTRHLGVFASPGRIDRQIAYEALDRVGIAELADRLFPTLSGGEQQLVLIARTLASQSPVLTLDEPSTGLDLHNQARILVLIRELVADGLAVLLTTHEPDHALQLGGSVVLMGANEVRIGPAGELLDEARLSALYGIDVHLISYQDGDVVRPAIVTGYREH